MVRDEGRYSSLYSDICYDIYISILQEILLYIAKTNLFIYEALYYLLLFHEGLNITFNIIVTRCPDDFNVVVWGAVKEGISMVSEDDGHGLSWVLEGGGDGVGGRLAVHYEGY